ncbi:hypothetical protein [Streptomyces massasporeus]|uniref:hypothetical protein n=1 Tax=Streptomyces massasporeus TaxID=67324 RepID=UPI0036590EAC
MSDDIRGPSHGHEAARDHLRRAREAAADAAQATVGWQPFDAGSGPIRLQKVAVRLTDRPDRERAYGNWRRHVDTCEACWADCGCLEEKALWQAYRDMRSEPSEE